MNKEVGVKTDCFAYKKNKGNIAGIETETCDALTDLYCKKEECPFYINKQDFLEKNRKLSKILA